MRAGNDASDDRTQKRRCTPGLPRCRSRASPTSGPRCTRTPTPAPKAKLVRSAHALRRNSARSCGFRNEHDWHAKVCRRPGTRTRRCSPSPPRCRGRRSPSSAPGCTGTATAVRRPMPVIRDREHRSNCGGSRGFRRRLCLPPGGGLESRILPRNRNSPRSRLHRNPRYGPGCNATLSADLSTKPW